MISNNALILRCRKESSDANNDQFFQDVINEGQKVTENELNDFVVEDTRTGNTIAGFNQIPTPENYLRAKFLYVTNNNSRYDFTFIYTEPDWQRAVAFQQSSQSNYGVLAFPRIDYVELYPTPASILPYTFQYVSEYHDMQYLDTTQGTIVSITNSAPLLALPYATVVGVGVSWQPYMAGQFFQMAGDKQWYKITSVPNTTTLILGKAYAGIAIGGFPSLNYTIGEMPRLPEAAHMLLYYYAMKEYYGGPKKDATKGTYFSNQYDKWLSWAKGTFGSRTEMGVIPSQRALRRFNARNPNLFPLTINGGGN